MEVEKEPRFSRGRPRKLARRTAKRIEYFEVLLKEAGDGGDVQSRPSRPPIATKEVKLGG